MTLSELKSRTYQECANLIGEKISILKSEIAAAQAAANEDTKSSAGDKYETGRAMMMLEKEKLTAQLNEVSKLKKHLDQIDPLAEKKEVSFGALVKTSMGIYFIGVGLGAIQVDDEQVFAVSSISPIAQSMLGGSCDDQINFNNKTIRITALA